MKRHVQTEGVRRWAGEHVIDLQAEPFKVIDAFFEEYGNCVVKGCGVLDWQDGTYHVESGLVGLQGTDPEGNPTYKVAPFAGVTAASLPAYFVLRFDVVEREYVDEKKHPIYYEYRTELVPEKPADEPYLEIGISGAVHFLDVTGVTHKLDQDGDGKDVVVSFEEAAERVNVEFGDTLSGLWGKARKWFSDLKTVAFSGKTADLTDDADHRLTTDTEKIRWNNTYTQQETDDKDAEVLRAAKEHANTEAETLGLNVYRRNETYNRGEINTLDAGILALAKEYARQLRNDLVNGAGEAMDTLFELSNALNNDPNFATTIMALIAGKADSWHTHTKDQITNFPTSLPASDVSAWAKQPNKPSYTPSEIGAATANHNHAGVYQPAGNYAPSNHNHDSAYQPKGSYATANHGHNASAITEETNKRFMTDAERSKLAGLKSIIVSKNINGYVKIGGIIIQWGRNNALSKSNTTVSYTLPFSSVYSVVITAEDSNVDQNKSLVACNISNNNFQINNTEKSHYYCRWIAIGSY